MATSRTTLNQPVSESEIKDGNQKEDALSSLFTGSGRSSYTSSATSRSRKKSRIEQVTLGGTKVLLELDEELTLENEGAHAARKDSLEEPTTIGGINVQVFSQEDALSVDKEIKMTIAHHSPDVDENAEGREGVVRPPKSDDESDGLDSSSYKWKLFKEYFTLLTYHLHLAFASPSIVRIPHLVHKYASNRGSAFFFAYVVCLLTIGIPICFMETVMAQFSSLGPINLFAGSLPLIKGVGLGMIIMSTVLMTISSTVLSWSLFYLFQTMNSELPWETCPDNMTAVCMVPEVDKYLSYSELPSKTVYIPSDYYFQNDVIKSFEVESGDPLEFNKTLVLLLLGLWIPLLFFVSRHFVWRPKLVTSCFAIVTLSLFLALMIKGLQLEDSGRGLREAFHLNFTEIRYELGRPDLWMDSLGQVLWSLGPCIGVLICKASYNNFRKKISQEVLLSAALNLLVTVLVMMAIFPYAGYLFRNTVDRNLGYFFVMSSYAVTIGPLPHVQSFLLYLCISECLLSYTVMMADSVVITVTDSLPISWRGGLKRFSVDIFVCILGFLGALIFVTKEGIYYITTTDRLVPWVAGISLGILELLGILYIYGTERLMKQLREMRNSRSFFIPFAKFFVLPSLLGLFLWVAISGISDPIPWDHVETSRDDSYYIVGLCLALLPVVISVFAICAQGLSKLKNFKALLKPTSDWGSAISRHTELMKKTNKRRDRRKPCLVVMTGEDSVPDNLSTWLPFGYSWIPSSSAEILLKEGHSNVNLMTRKSLATLLLEKHSQWGRYLNLTFHKGSQELLLPEKSQTDNTERLREGNFGEIATTSKSGRRSYSWSISNFLSLPSAIQEPPVNENNQKEGKFANLKKIP